MASAYIADPQSWNRYAYVRNNPTNSIDPYGMAEVNPSVYQYNQSYGWTNRDYDEWWYRAMGNYSFNDFNAMLAGIGWATAPGYVGVDSAFTRYMDVVNQGQANLAKEASSQTKNTASPPNTTGDSGGFWSTFVSVLGKVWNAPNTAIGLTWGFLGVPFGATVSRGNNAIQFTNHPFMPFGAITLGNVIVYPSDLGPDLVGQHEQAHTKQGQLTGPLYLPLNIIGIGISIIADGVYDGPLNFMEVGPKCDPSRPWP